MDLQRQRLHLRLRLSDRGHANAARGEIAFIGTAAKSRDRWSGPLVALPLMLLFLKETIFLVFTTDRPILLLVTMTLLSCTNALTPLEAMPTRPTLTLLSTTLQFSRETRTFSDAEVVLTRRHGAGDHAVANRTLARSVTLMPIHCQTHVVEVGIDGGCAPGK